MFVYRRVIIGRMFWMCSVLLLLLLLWFEDNQRFFVLTSKWWWLHSLKLTANAPENRQNPKRKFIFEPSIFRCELLVSWRVEQLNDPVVPDEFVLATVGKRRVPDPNFPYEKSHLFHRSFVHFEENTFCFSRWSEKIEVLPVCPKER